MTQHDNLNTPWSLHFERDGTDDVGTIYDANSHELVHSRQFSLPEGEDPVPPTLAALRLMVIAPKLLIAAKATLTALELILEVDDPTTYTQANWEAEPLSTLRAVIAEAEESQGAV